MEQSPKTGIYYMYSPTVNVILSEFTVTQQDRSSSGLRFFFPSVALECLKCKHQGLGSFHQTC